MLKNSRVIVKGLSFSYIYIFVYLFTGVLTTPLLLHHFDADYFALLMIIYTLITYLNNLRFGLPENLAVMLAKSSNKTYKFTLIQKTFLLLCFIILLALIIFYILDFIIGDWRILLGDVYALNLHTVLSVFYILIIFALIKIPFEVSLAVFIGFNEVYYEKIYKIVTLLANFLLVLYIVYFDKSILFFVVGAGFLDLFVVCIAFFHAFSRYEVKSVKGGQVKSSALLKDAFLFFQLSLTQTFIWGMGIFVVTHLLSLGDVTIYSLTMKIYVYILYAFVIVNSVIAPVYGKYFADDNWQEIKKVFFALLFLLPIIGGVIWMGTLFFFKDIMTLWTGSKNFYIGPWFVLFMGAFFYLTGFVNTYVTLLYSIGKIKSIVFLKWKEVFISFFLIMALTYLAGLVGVALGLMIATFYISIRLLPNIIMSVTENKIIFDFSMHIKHFIYVLVPNVFFAFIVNFSTDNIFIKTLLFSLTFCVYIFFSWKFIPSNQQKYILSKIKKGL
ncbi:lipopolysaccharide biosynthesis protein [Sulfurimonas indica]|uniref:lipopolysaccharide biosynthesis protein n=1 Tax=Sulfurimonas indica TaxID=2508707 RepID=UPI0012659D33|nr:hypothetical protein [Sulfurimonas indica]